MIAENQRNINVLSLRTGRIGKAENPLRPAISIRRERREGLPRDESSSNPRRNDSQSKNFKKRDNAPTRPDVLELVACHDNSLFTYFLATRVMLAR
ncbi:hypothetical protein Zmor_025034 [Zophobas morio]|uniref:Uncharacterized protein n=1 Tax=Zophobas morio TaxID=2755281 RepID=A0AA38M3P3_9CUCU|nr:hypothetical protein Zmor_025034 [Zophobas morio]